MDVLGELAIPSDLKSCSLETLRASATTGKLSISTPG
jgi:hypothetical protein